MKFWKIKHSHEILCMQITRSTFDSFKDVTQMNDWFGSTEISLRRIAVSFVMFRWSEFSFTLNDLSCVRCWELQDRSHSIRFTLLISPCSCLFLTRRTNVYIIRSWSFTDIRCRPISVLLGNLIIYQTCLMSFWWRFCLLSPQSSVLVLFLGMKW
jgi:hypothetical protein